MDRKQLDRAIPLGYAGLVVLSAVFVPIALAGIAIFGGLVVAVYYVMIRPRLLAEQPDPVDETTDDPRPPHE